MAETGSTRQSPPVAPRWGVIAAVSVIVLAAHLPGTHATAWHFFDDAVRLLAGGGPAGEATGLHLYRDHPEFQFGPLSIVAAAPFAALGPDIGVIAVMIAGSAAGLLAFWFLLGAVHALGARTRRVVSTAAGIVFVAVWGDVAVRTAHIDDVIALLATAAALRSCARGNARTTAILLGVAAAAKPWAIAFAPVVLAPIGPRRALRLVVVAAVPVLTWAPFLLAESQTFDVRDFVIDVDPTSTLRALGVDADATPDWARPVQLLSGFALAWLVTRQGRWHAAVLAAVACRLLFEPGAHRYYTAGAVLGALLIELVARPRSLPWRSAGLAIILEVTALPDAPESRRAPPASRR